MRDRRLLAAVMSALAWVGCEGLARDNGAEAVAPGTSVPVLRPSPAAPPVAAATTPAAARLPFPLDADLSELDDWWRAPWPVATRIDPPDSRPRSLADAEVVEVGEQRVLLKSTIYLNADRAELVQHWDGLVPTVKVGSRLSRGASLGAGAGRLGLYVDGSPVNAEPWIRSVPMLPDPHAEPVVVLISQARYAMRIWRRGPGSAAGGSEPPSKIGDFAVSFGQAEGPKVRQGDNKTPRGMYFVVAKSTGPFEGEVGAFYGGHWIKLNYPNPWDAVRGVDSGLITPERAASIRSAWTQRALTSQNTRLGGGIGLHGWASEWPDDGSRHLSWGCIVVHLKDIAHVYAALPEGAMVVIR